MEIFSLDRDYTLLQVIDQFDSIAWSDRYNEPGEFELKLYVDPSNFSSTVTLGYLSKDSYLSILESDRIMIVEKQNFSIGFDQGNYIIVSGRSLESILDRRCILTKIIIDNEPIDEAILKLLNECIIKPANSDRQIAAFSFKPCTDPEIKAIKVSGTYLGENLLDIVNDWCQANNVGYRVLPDRDNAGFIFELYKGVDRSWGQNERAPVVFSTKYENLIQSNYVDSNERFKNIVHVVNESEQTETHTMEVYNGDTKPVGIHRRELYLSMSVDQPEVEPYKPQSTINYSEEDLGTWESTIDYQAYYAARELRRKQTQAFVDNEWVEGIDGAQFSGTEADKKVAYVDWRTNQIKSTDEAFRRYKYVPNEALQQAIAAANAAAKAKYEAALANAKQYVINQLRTAALDDLKDYKTTKAFDGDIVNYFQFVAQRDYYLGDIVQMVNGLYINVATRFTEITYIQDGEGIRAVPTFLTDDETEVLTTLPSE